MITSVPWWKRWASYIQPVTLERTSSEINPNLLVQMKKGELMLSTENALYSYGARYYNFSQLFEQLQLPRGGSKVLLLGLGLGSIPLILEQTHKKRYHTIAVEIDAEIIRLAQHYSLPQLQSNIEVVHADAASFLSDCQDSFDLILVDLFIDADVPSVFIEESIIRSYPRLLTDKGYMIQNFIHLNDADQELIEIFASNALPYFPHHCFLPIWKSRMFVSDSRYLK